MLFNRFWAPPKFLANQKVGSGWLNWIAGGLRAQTEGIHCRAIHVAQTSPLSLAAVRVATKCATTISLPAACQPQRLDAKSREELFSDGVSLCPTTDGVRQVVGAIESEQLGWEAFHCSRAGVAIG